MDEEWEKRGAVEAPECKKEPSHYITSKNVYYGCEPDEKTIGYVVSEIGSETIMYASDYPHWDMSWPESGSLDLATGRPFAGSKTEHTGGQRPTLLRL